MFSMEAIERFMLDAKNYFAELLGPFDKNNLYTVFNLIKILIF